MIDPGCPPRIALICPHGIDRFSASDAIYQVPLCLARHGRLTLFTTEQVRREPLASLLAGQVLFGKDRHGVGRVYETSDKNAPDWDLVVSGVDASSATAAIAIQKSINVPWVAVCEDHPFGPRYENPGPLRRLERAIRTPILRRLLSRADRIAYFINPDVCDFLRLDPARALALTNSVDFDSIAPIRAAADSSRNPADPVPRVIAYIGVISEAKGALEMLEVLARVRRSVPEARLKLIGDLDKTFAPRFQAHVEKLGLARAVELTGLLPATDALRHAAFAAVCLHAYRPEQWLYWNQPLKICEYLGLGRAVVSWDYPGVRDLIPANTLGRLAPPGDLDAMADALCEVLTDDAARLDLQQRGLDHAMEHLSWKTTADRFWNSIEPLLRKRSDPA